MTSIHAVLTPATRLSGSSLLAVLMAVFLLSTPVRADSHDEYEGLSPGEGRDEVHGYCGACHSVRLVTQQGLNRKSWRETLDDMVEEQGMPELDEETNALILDYLSKHLNVDNRPAHVTRTP